MYLGLPEERFLKLTPRQYRTLMRRHEERVEHEAYQLEFAAAIVAHTVACYAGKSLKDSARPTYGDFMPSVKRKRPKTDPRAAATDSLRAFFRARAEAAEQKSRVIKGERIA